MKKWKYYSYNLVGHLYYDGAIRRKPDGPRDGERFYFFKSMSYTKCNAEFARIPLFKILRIAIASQSIEGAEEIKV